MKCHGMMLVAWLCVASAASAVFKWENGIAAVVNDKVITIQELMDVTRRLEEGLRLELRGDPEKLAKELAKIRDDGLEMLIDHQLVLQDAKNAGVLLPKSFIEEQIEERIREKYGDRISLIKDLRAEGITYETYRQQVRDEIIVYIMERRNISSVILISPARIEEYYQANLSKFRVGDEVKLRVIFLKVEPGRDSLATRKLAREIEEKIESGTPFAEMAAVYSEGSQRAFGGDWDWCEPVRNLKRGLFDAAFGLEPGERSGVIGHVEEPGGAYWIYHYDETGRTVSARKYSRQDLLLEEKKGDDLPAADGLVEAKEYYLMLVEDKRVARVRPLAEVQEEIERDLISAERRRLRKKWVDRLRAKSYVGYYY